MPSPKISTTLPLSAYVGTYVHPGYQTVTIYLDESSSVLRADRSFVTWPEYMTFEHVSGEHFLIKAIGDADFGALMIPSVYAAEFRLGSDGRPSELGIAWEEEMKGEKIWFQRV